MFTSFSIGTVTCCCPWQYTLDFGGDIKTVEKKVGAPFLSESVVAPKLKEGTQSAAIGITVTVTDAAGTAAEWSRPSKQWVTVTPAMPAAVVPTSIVPPPSGVQPSPITPAQGETPPAAAANRWQGQDTWPFLRR